MMIMMMMLMMIKMTMMPIDDDDAVGDDYDDDDDIDDDDEYMMMAIMIVMIMMMMMVMITEIALLSDTMFDEADKDGDGVMSERDLAEMVDKFPNALEALTKNASIWLQPDLRRHQHKSRVREIFSRRYLANNYKKLTFQAVFWVLNIILFAVNAFIYRRENRCIILARGCGMCLNFTSALILLLPLRMCISYLRLTPLCRVLPLDHNISLHKMVGLVIALMTIAHTAGHLGNAVWLTERTNLTVPEILFTTDAKIGWIGHLAPLTGVILDVILLTIVVASRPFVRRSGYFQAFYWTHKLYDPYYILTFIHASNLCLCMNSLYVLTLQVFYWTHKLYVPYFILTFIHAPNF
ncbi:NADPH oxidase 5 [Elysia marginata]|uniref:NADPH oxidase 5 n=1 Tax=Elysia marginata TaxID=1093978 RepID=A0AAV4IYL8_9GAST|nr:NADPH oxidase 5 [Elysia marginata]